MTIVNTLSNRWRLAQLSGEVHPREDSFKIALMTPAFVFDPDVHERWDQVSGEEIVAGSGYSAGGQILVSGEMTQNNTTDRAIMTWSNNNVTAVGGAIADTGSAIIYDDTHASDLIFGHSDFGVDYSVTSGMTLRFSSIVLNL